MRILLIHQIFVTPDEGGGTRHYEMCKHLVQQGIQVDVIASEIDYLSGEKRINKREVKEGINIYYAKAYSKLHKSIIHRALSFFSFSFFSFYYGLKLKNIDVIWGTSPPLFQAFSSLVLAKIKRVPFIFEVRDLWVDFAKELGLVTNPLIYGLFKFVEKVIYKNADKVITNSPGFLPYISKYVPLNSISVFPNGVDMENFGNINSDKVEKYREKFELKNKFIVLYAGNLGIANDIENILFAAEELSKLYNDIKFVFIGGGLNVGEYKQKNIKNVCFFPSQPKKDMPEILNMADVCLATLKDIPLFATVYPNKVFDYMAAKKPVILAIDGAIREVIEKSNCGIYINPGNSQELVQAILKYYKNHRLIHNHGENGRKYVIQYFDRKKITIKFNKYLESLAKNET
jgi:glycosyltransferase involved in cell wall biosynthesis